MGLTRCDQNRSKICKKEKSNSILAIGTVQFPKFKMGKTDKEKDFKDMVSKYLTNQNRPYSVNDLVANLRNEIPKTALQKVVDSLVEEGTVKEKVNGKQKAYVISQDQFSVASDDELQKLDEEANKIQQELTELNGQIKAFDEKFKAYKTQMTTNEAAKKLEEVRAEVAQLEVKLESLANQSDMIDQDIMNVARKKCTDMVKYWKSRKRMCNDMTNAILEGYPHPKRQFCEEVGIEDDND